jgi:hypothetical protein
MIFGNKSNLMKHLAAKHPTFSRKVIERGTYDQSVEPMRPKGQIGLESVGNTPGGEAPR